MARAGERSSWAANSARIAGGTATVAIAAVALTKAAARLTLPRTTGELPVAGLDGPIAIDRDDVGIPALRATSDRDAFFAQGWVTAQDRLWQIDSLRRLCSGRLSEVVGPAALESDRLMRTIGLRRIAERLNSRVSAESRIALDAYAAGINACVRHIGVRLPLEFRLLRYRPQPWSAADSIAFFRFLGWQLGGYVERIAAVGRCRALLPPDLFDAIFGVRPFTAPPALDPEAEAAVLVRAEAARRAAEQVTGTSTRGGSNAWAVAGTRTRSGKPLLANDPHLHLGLPAIWYEVSIESPSYRVAGAALPGVPGVVIGRTDSTAWGATSTMFVCADLYSEEVNPSNPEQYRTEDGWAELTTTEETIRVRGKPDEQLLIKASRHGPIVSPVLSGSPELLALRWTGEEDGDEVAALLGAARARSWSTFRDAVRHLTSPMLNLVYADASGTIAYQVAGRYPIRTGGGLAPIPGCASCSEGGATNDDHEWHGWIPFDALPSAENPASGVITSANTRMVGETYPFALTGAWEPPHRLARIQELLGDRRRLTMHDMRAMQADVLSGRAVGLLPALRAALARGETPALRWAARQIDGWSGELAEHAVGAALFEAWFQACADRLLRLHMTPEAVTVLRRFLRMGWGDELTGWIEGQLCSPDPVWLGGEVPQHFFRVAMEDAMHDLRARLGHDRGTWTWGKLHTITLPHPLGIVPVVGRLFNRGPFSMDGGDVTISAGVMNAGEDSARYAAVIGSSYRLVVDLAAPETSWSCLPSGQSGQLGSPHYDDQTWGWLRHSYHPLLLASEMVRSRRVAHLRLEPAAS